MAEGRQDPQSNDSIKKLIRTKAEKFSRNPALREWTRDDLSQELELAWLQAEHRYDPSRGDILTYADFVFNNTGKNLIARQKAARRDYRLCTKSLDDEVGLDDGPGMTGHEIYSADGYFNATGGRHSGRGQIADLRIDVSQALRTLPDQLQQFAVLLANAATITEAARQAGISRPTAYKWRRQIESALRKAGLGDYLPPSTRPAKKPRRAGLHFLRKSCSEARREES